MYLASKDKVATVHCFLVDHEITLEPINQVYLLTILVLKQFVQFESVNPTNFYLIFASEHKT